MSNEHRMIKAVYAAKESMENADALIRSYIPFIQAEASGCIGRACTDADDEYSIAMLAFHEAILGYVRERGSFLSYASILIRSRLIDFARMEKRHRGHLSLDQSDHTAEEDQTVGDRIRADGDFAEESARLDATKEEIAELSRVMELYGVSFSDVAANAPKQKRTLEACARVISFAAANPALLAELLETKKLPLAALTAGSGVERKTLERHRKYILVMLLIQTNGYEIIRGHIRHVLTEGGKVSV